MDIVLLSTNNKENVEKIKNDKAYLTSLIEDESVPDSTTGEGAN